MIDNISFFEIPTDWQIHRNQFNDLRLVDDSLDDIRFQKQYCQEDLLWIQKKKYHLDLGWYGDNNFDLSDTGFMLVLFRGHNWNNCELLELVRSKSISQIHIAFKEIVQLVAEDFYSDMVGYKIDDNSDNSIGQHSQFSVRDQEPKK